MSNNEIFGAAVRDRCPPGWMLHECGSLCQDTCEDYLFDDPRACPAVCGPPACTCPQGLVVFRDRCVDPLECYALIYGTKIIIITVVLYIGDD